MIRVVLDTNVLFSAIFKSTGTQARLLDRLLTDSTIVLYVSPAVMGEYHEMLFRPVLRQHAPKVEYLLGLLTTLAILVVPTASVIAASDPDDNCFLECAGQPVPTILLPATSATFQKPGRKRKS
jgi:putative PIN family toxin of toxin-antitoxin system